MCNFKEYNKSLCCGCGACELICPQNCINMEFDEEGFLYPKICIDKCIQCGLCKGHCPIIIDTRNTGVLSSYGLIHKDTNVIGDSTSGGAFTAIAEYVLARNGKVFGCTFNDNIEAITISIEKFEELYLLRGSKYVQCNTDKQYRSIKETLESKRYVLYCATPCQIAGLKSYLGRDYEKLILVDLFCHGTPSPGLFKKYIQWLGEKHNGKVTGYRFRDKRYGWVTKGYFYSGKECELPGSDPYYYSFLKGRTYRPICYKCKYACTSRPGDITIGDFWGVEEYHPNISTENGVSAVLINTTKGQIVFDMVKAITHYFETTLDNISSHNKQLTHPTEEYVKRKEIYAHLHDWTFERLSNRYLYSDSKIIRNIKKVIPESIKIILRKYIKMIRR